VSFDLGAATEYFPVLMLGLFTTLTLTGWAFVIGIAVGLVAAMARLSRPRVLRIVSSAYVDFFRTTPALVQIFWVFFVLPLMIGRDIDAYSASVIALGLNTGAFMAEIFRAGVLGVDRGQVDAADVLGLRPVQRFRYIVLPQALRIVLPAIAATTMLLLKGTSLAAAISVGELTYKATLVTLISGRFFEIFTLAALIYIAVIVPIGLGTSLLERQLRASERLATR